MRLYATTTSERASKGQGGNQYLDIRIKDKDGQEFATFFISDMPDGIIIRYDIDDDVAYFEKEPKTKGEKQKGEQCDGKHEDVKAIIDCKSCSSALDRM